MRDSRVLPSRTLLGTYRIEYPLDISDDTITYLAEDLERNERVFLTEFFPGEMATRVAGESGGNGIAVNTLFRFDYVSKIESFLGDARTFSHYRHANLLQTQRHFEANATAYCVTDYKEGNTLAAYLSEHEGVMPEKEILHIVSSLVSALETLHACDALHKNIKPENVYLCKNGHVMLTNHANSYFLPASGYAPMEQYAGGCIKPGPYSDIYALGALVYELMMRKSPPDAPTRSRAFVAGEADPYLPVSANGVYTEALCDFVNRSLRLDVSHRPQSVDEIRRNVFDDEAEGGPVPKPSNTRTSSGFFLSNNYLGSFVIITLLAVTLFYFYASPHDVIVFDGPGGIRPYMTK